MKRALWSLTVLVASIGAPLAQADIMYSYTGNHFTTFTGSVYSTTDSVSGFFTLTSALGSSLSLETITPNTFSFTDQHQTFTNTTPSLLTAFFVATDVAGNITQWIVDLRANNGNPPHTEIVTFNEPGTIIDGGLGTASGATQAGSVSDAPGSWTKTATTTDTPEPATAGPLMLVAMVSGFMARKQVAQGRRPANGTTR